MDDRQPAMTLPVACSLSGQEAHARVSAWRDLTDRALIRRERIDTGVRLIFRGEPGVAETVARLIELEGQCCAWMSFRVRDENDLIVDVGAADETGRRALGEMFTVP